MLKLASLTSSSSQVDLYQKGGMTLSSNQSSVGIPEKYSSKMVIK